MKKKLNEVLLLKQVPNLGQPGTIIKVKPGYSRNYLFPFQIAKFATEETITQFKAKEQERLADQKDSQQKNLEFKDLLENLEPLILEKEVVYETEQLFGKVTKNEIFSLLQEKINLSQILEKTKIKFSDIKELGEYPISILISKEITATITLIIQAK